MTEHCDHALYYDLEYNECPFCGEHLGGGKLTWIQKCLKAEESHMLQSVLNERDARVKLLKDLLREREDEIAKLKAKVKRLEKLVPPKYKHRKGTRAIEL